MNRAKINQENWRLARSSSSYSSQFQTAPVPRSSRYNLWEEQARECSIHDDFRDRSPLSRSKGDKLSDPKYNWMKRSSDSNSDVSDRKKKCSDPKSDGFDYKRNWRENSNDLESVGSASDYYWRKKGSISNLGRSDTKSNWRTKCDDLITEQFGTRGSWKKEIGTVKLEKHIINVEFLIHLLEKDPEQIVMDIMNEQNGIDSVVNSSDMENDFIVLMIHVLNKVCESHFELKTKIIKKNLNRLNKKLLSYLNMLHLQRIDEQNDNTYFWKDMEKFWNSLIKISHYIVATVPNYAVEVIPKIVKSAVTAILNIEEAMQIAVSDDVKKSLVTVQNNLELIFAQFRSRTLPEPANLSDKPPNDFRDISVYPSIEELTSDSTRFLRKNVIYGPYKDADDYLDIQYRLLREDFVSPLRQGIMSFLSGTKPTNVRVYRNVYFLTPEVINNQNCYKIDFGKKCPTYEKSGRFMFGALLCFTTDNFKTLTLGRVAETKTETLEQGHLIVGFDTDHNITIDYNTPYLMLESTVYFEPYYHVLSVLKNMQNGNFPMEKYIIKVDNTTFCPEYIRNVDIIKSLEWQDMQFNRSQEKACKAALTQEFAVIQGPPGTGKTFLGLQIAKILLELTEYWYERTPILVICYTNHALDQFLEGLLPYTERIIRVGGQSKNEILEKYNLRKQHFFRNAAQTSARSVLKDCSSYIRQITYTLSSLKKYDSIMDFSCFETIIPYYSETWFYSATGNNIISWLFSTEEMTFKGQNKNLKSEEDLRSQDESSDEEMEGENFDADIFTHISFKKIPALLSVENLLTRIELNKSEIKRLSNLDEISEEDEKKLYGLRNNLPKEQDTLRILEFQLKLGKQGRFHRMHNYHKFSKNPHTLSSEDRWNLYFTFLELYEKKLSEKYGQLNNTFQDLYIEHNQLRAIEDVDCMKDALVVGMTTTGAARLHSSLQCLKSPIVIVEEAAEVLEAHIVTALTSNCQHLILIGDHLQLRPITSDYEIEKHYNLGISLFERMVLNKINYNTLDVQHRMRPEICALITPHIYPNLQNHTSVLNRPMVTGVDKPLFFIDHSSGEVACNDESKKNPHEAQFLIRLANHLLLNGHSPEDITILAAYLGQMYEMQRERQNYPLLETVRIRVVDNYQGEESKIILLSLVRSNDEGKIGFLNMRNRVCVALSRARNGLYIMGNMKHLCQNNTTKIWPQIRKALEVGGSIGPALKLRCRIHPYSVNEVRNPDDFAALASGGCREFCNGRLSCGHRCPKRCHLVDEKHEEFKCEQLCSKRLCETNPNHTCKKLCSDKCGACLYTIQKTLNCGHTVDVLCSTNMKKFNCTVNVFVKLECGHEVKKRCYLSLDSFICPVPCSTVLGRCGHPCQWKCHSKNDPDHRYYKCTMPCKKFALGCSAKPKHFCKEVCFKTCSPCLISVKKTRTTCPHSYMVACNENVDTLLCENPCQRILPCGHNCTNLCSEWCGPCVEKVKKIIEECQHEVEIECSTAPTHKMCTKKCPLILNCGHNCPNKCYESCTSACKVLVDCSVQSPCGHFIKQIECYMKTDPGSYPKELLKNCTELCSEMLHCGHACTGSCSECYQGRLHEPCIEKCAITMFCNHTCPMLCDIVCKECSLPCQNRCIHRKCERQCGVLPCSCSGQCQRNCKHQRCSNPCSEICNVEPCQQPCPKSLKCGHPCRGFCGDPCPKICPICNKDKINALVEYFKIENIDDSRFVYLRDCKHIVESLTMNEWLHQSANEVHFKVCPLCKTPIITTLRYADYMKKDLQDFQRVKCQLNDEKKGHKDDALVQLKISEHIEDILKGIGDENELQLLKKINFIINILKNPKPLSEQQVDDIICEVKRLAFTAHLLKITTIGNLPDGVKVLCDNAEKMLTSVSKFSEEYMNQTEEIFKQIGSVPFLPDISYLKAEYKFNKMELGCWYKCTDNHIYFKGNDKCLMGEGDKEMLNDCPECSQQKPNL